MDKRSGNSKNVLMHYRGMLLLSIGLFAGLIAYLFFTIGRYGLEDQIAYQKLINGDQEKELYNASYTSRQHREGLQKDVFFVEKQQLLHLRLYSEKSEIVFERQKGQTEVIENMDKVTCCIQEELFFILPDGREALKQDGRLLIRGEKPQDADSWVRLDSPGILPMQKIMVLEADHASYFYKRDLFSAENVDVSRYVAKGHALDEADEALKPLSSGKAGRVEFSMAGKGLNFKADKFKGTLFVPRREL
jgi:hypothetical protein